MKLLFSFSQGKFIKRSLNHECLQDRVIFTQSVFVCLVVVPKSFVNRWNPNFFWLLFNNFTFSFHQTRISIFIRSSRLVLGLVLGLVLDLFLWLDLDEAQGRRHAAIFDWLLRLVCSSASCHRRTMFIDRCDTLPIDTTES